MELDDPISDGMTKWQRRWQNMCLPILCSLIVFILVGIGWAIGTRHVMESQEYRLGKAIIQSSDDKRPYTITIY